MLQHEKGLFTFRLFGPCWLHTRAVGTGRVAGCICPPPDSSRSVNPISTMRGRFCPLQRYYPGFSDLPSALPTQSSPSPSNVSTLSISHIYFGMCVAYIAKGGNAIHWTGPLLSLLCCCIHRGVGMIYIVIVRQFALKPCTIRVNPRKICRYILASLIEE